MILSASASESDCDALDDLLAGRMLSKGVINGVVEWESAREFFYWRLRRGLAERQLQADIAKANPDMSEDDIKKLHLSWFARFQGQQVLLKSLARINGCLVLQRAPFPHQ
eukprot:SAG31_NODE_163_length_21856_cov_7.550214_2_plen_110_part_00